MPAAQNIRSDDTNSDLIEHGVNYNAVCGRDESYENVEFGNTHAGSTMLHEMSIGVDYLFFLPNASSFRQLRRIM